MKKTLTTLTLMITLSWSFTSQATAYDEANWYVSIDVQQVRDKIVPLLPHNEPEQHEFSVAHHLPQEVHQVTLYGHSEAENDLSMAIKGDFARFSLNEYLLGLLYMVDDKEDVSLALFDSEAHGGSVVEHYQISGDNETKSFYSAIINEQTLVLSFDQQEVKNWIDKKYASHDLNSSGLVSLLVNIESAMAHMGADLASNQKSFNSAVFKKITQFSASVYETGDSLTIESALTTADEATARQLEQVINGLVAMNALSNLDQDKPALNALASALQISQQGQDLLITTALPYALIPEINID
ncbi:hypothetical protein ACFODZ_11735 [Marinicella sediminis]|uniref:Uncharacterized protein n=1 Tax=Marinicella sediminis TaxID=1792834 RepID=A0ABV7J9W1_9GAMM|nr:hypothetical protein [Marinicella sediminis]